jgi:hypothetical protein
VSLKTKMTQMFSGHTETGEKHPDEQLKTRYYKTTKDKLMIQINSILRQQKGYEIVAESKERGEITVTVHGTRTYFVVITVIMVRPFRTAVDISVTAKRGIDLGVAEKMILQLYEKIGGSFEYIGNGLSEKI